MDGNEVQPAVVAAGLRAVVAAIDEDELTASAATRHRIEGAAAALDTLSRSVADPPPVPGEPSPGSPR